MEVSPIAGWFISGKIPSRNGMIGGCHIILGNQILPGVKRTVDGPAKSCTKRSKGWLKLQKEVRMFTRILPHPGTAPGFFPRYWNHPCFVTHSFPTDRRWKPTAPSWRSAHGTASSAWARTGEVRFIGKSYIICARGTKETKRTEENGERGCSGWQEAQSHTNLHHLWCHNGGIWAGTEKS